MASRFSVRPGFLLSFALLLTIGAIGLAYVISTLVGNDIRKEQVATATERAQLLAQASFAPTLNFRLHGLNAAQVRPLDSAALAARQLGDASSVAVWDRRGEIVYATNHGQIGRRYLMPPAVTKAFAGETVTTRLKKSDSPIDTSTGEQIQVAVPIYGKGSKTPHAVLEMSVPYAPIHAEISSRTRPLDYILLGGALLFLAGVWPRLVLASRALRDRDDPERKRLIEEMHTAIDKRQLELHYQPKVDLRTGDVSGVEALLRWNHPEDGLIAPSKFLAAVAGSDLMGPLTVHVVEMALRDCAGWRALGVSAGVDINLDVANVLDPQLPKEVERLLAKWKLPAQSITFEVTEAAIQASPEQATSVLRALAAMGTRLSIDNFGTGYSSLALLRELPVREIKVDRSFVSSLLRSPADSSIVQAIIFLAHDLGLVVIAQGLEDDETLRCLAELGCDQAQGYYFSRPLDIAALLRWFEQPLVDGAPLVPVATA